MVRRIIPDSDFESDAEAQEQGLAAHKHSNGSQSPSPSPLPESKLPASTRKLGRRNELKLEAPATYEYDSDIYTDDSSMGSFIVYTEEDEHQGEEVSSGN